MKNLYFSKLDGLIPVIIQEDQTREILMFGYMNQEALKRTKRTGWVYFWSRKRNKLWMKGEESGNKLKVKNILIDCDRDTLLVKVELVGNFVCHKGARSCFSDRTNSSSSEVLWDLKI